MNCNGDLNADSPAGESTIPSVLADITGSCCSQKSEPRRHSTISYFVEAFRASIGRLYPDFRNSAYDSIDLTGFRPETWRISVLCLSVRSRVVPTFGGGQLRLFNELASSRPPSCGSRAISRRSAPRNTRSRLADCAFAGWELNPLACGKRFPLLHAFPFSGLGLAQQEVRTSTQSVPYVLARLEPRANPDLVGLLRSDRAEETLRLPAQP